MALESTSTGILDVLAVSGCVVRRKYGGVLHIGADKLKGPRRAQQQVNGYVASQSEQILVVKCEVG